MNTLQQNPLITRPAIFKKKEFKPWVRSTRQEGDISWGVSVIVTHTVPRSFNSFSF